MQKNILSKRLKGIIAFATMSIVCATTIIPANAVINTNSVNAAVTQQSTTGLRNVMYYGDWSIWKGEDNFFPKDMPVDKITHLNLAFMDFTSTGELKYCDKETMINNAMGHSDIGYDSLSSGLLNEFQVLREKNPNLKIGISLGGWSKSADFSTICRNQATLDKFVKNVAAFVKYTNMDFVDIDWEYPNNVRAADLVDNKNDEGTPSAGADDKANYIKLLQGLRTELDKQGVEIGKKYELSAALPMAKNRVEDGVDVKRMFELLDWGNIMTYDAAGAWEGFSGHQSALYDNPNSPYAGKGFSVDNSIKNYMALGAPSNKLVIGAAYYTRGWEKVSNNVPDKSLPGLYGTAEKVNKDADGALSYGAQNYAPIVSGDGGRHGGVWGWRTQSAMKAKYPGLKEYWDDTAKAPYLYADNGAFFTYDNVRSIQEKAKYVKANNLGGMIAWMASQDATTTSTKRDQLTNATKEALFGTGELPKYEVKYQPAKVSLNLTAGKPQWGTGGALKIDFKNIDTLTGQGEVLTTTEAMYKSLRYTKMYIKTEGFAITTGNYPAPTVTQENGYYVLNFDGYESKYIKPGQGMSFDLNLDKLISDISGVKEVYITQRIMPSSQEIRKQYLIGGPVIFDKEDVNTDGKVDVTDLTLVASKYNLIVGQTGYDKKYDINEDGIIDLFDLTMVSKKIK